MEWGREKGYGRPCSCDSLLAPALAHGAAAGSQPICCCSHGKRFAVDQHILWPVRRPVHWPVAQPMQAVAPSAAEKVCTWGGTQGTNVCPGREVEGP